jgi:hypothetical protein
VKIAKYGGVKAPYYVFGEDTRFWYDAENIIDLK